MIGQGSAFYSVGSLFFIIAQEFEIRSDLSQLKWTELIPSSLSLMIWLILNGNPFNIYGKVNKFVFN